MRKVLQGLHLRRLLIAIRKNANLRTLDKNPGFDESRIEKSAWGQ